MTIDHHATITDIKKLQRRLRKFPVKIQQRVIKSATNFAMTPVMKLAKQTVPVGDGLTPDGETREHLRDTIWKKSKLYKHRGTAVTVVGNDYVRGPHSHLVHDGTQPHITPLVHKRALTIEDSLIGRAVKHPGSEPRKYLLLAHQSKRGEVVSRFTLKMARGIEKEANKLAKT